jgi:sec-independent protein translocase protein TatA
MPSQGKALSPSLFSLPDAERRASGRDLLFFAGKGWKLMGFGIGEMLLVLALVILFFGAKRIPQIARGIGEGIKNFKQGLGEGKEESDDDRTLPPGGRDS